MGGLGGAAQRACWRRHLAWADLGGNKAPVRRAAHAAKRSAEKRLSPTFISELDFGKVEGSPLREGRCGLLGRPRAWATPCEGHTPRPPAVSLCAVSQEGQHSLFQRVSSHKLTLAAFWAGSGQPVPCCLAVPAELARRFSALTVQTERKDLFRRRCQLCVQLWALLLMLLNLH